MRDKEQVKMTTSNSNYSSGYNSQQMTLDRLGLLASRGFPVVHRLSRLSVHDRSNSDSNLAHPDLQNRSSLSVSKQEVILGVENAVLVFWDIREEVSGNDWIGLYFVGESNPTGYLSYKNRGISGMQKGQIIWILEPQPHFMKPVTKVCFKYYHGVTGELRAMTPTIMVRNPNVRDPDDSITDTRPLLHITITGLQAAGLKKGMFFNPDPYVKLSVQPGRRISVSMESHHGQNQRTTIADNTIMPSWIDQIFHFVAAPTDVLEIELKDKFVKSRPIISRFLGRLAIPVQRLVEKAALGEHQVSYNLGKRHPSDHVNGFLTFLVDILQQDESPEYTNLTNGDIITASDIDGGMPRSASYPSMSSIPDGITDIGASTTNRPVTEQSIDNAHDRAHRTISDPVTRSTRAESEPAPVSAHMNSGRNISPTTPTDTMTAPITDEQLSRVTHQARPRSLAEVQSIECLYSIEEVITPGSETLEGASGGEQLVNRPTHLKLHIPEAQTSPLSSSRTMQNNYETSTQTTPPSANIHQQNGSTVHSHLEFSELDSPVVTVTSSTVSYDADQESPAANVTSSDFNANISETSSAENYLSNQGQSNNNERSSQPDRTLESPIRSPETRRRAQSDIILKQEIEEEVEKLRQRTISSGNTALAAEGENAQSDDSGAAKSSSIMQTTTQRKTNSQKGNVTVQSNQSVNVVGDGESASHLTLNSSYEEGARKKITSHRPLTRSSGTSSGKSSSAGQRNNNNSLAHPGEDSSEKRTQQAAAGSNIMDQQPDPLGSSSVSISDSTPDYNAAVAMGADSKSLSPIEAPISESEQDSPLEASGGQDGSSENGSRRDDAVWQRRRRVRSAAPSLRVNIAGVTSESSDTDLTPTTPVLTPQRVTYQRYELPDDEEPLPSNWEARIDQYGRVFFIDHSSRNTTWTKPTANPASRRLKEERDSEQSRQQLDRRYQSIRRTLQVDDNQEDEDTQRTASSSTDQISQIPTPTGHRSVLESPAVKFITRPDFFNFLHSNAEAMATFKRNSSVKHMVNRIRRDPEKFVDYQHNRDLVALINLFVEPQMELPRAWESKKDKGGKSFFIDHNTRTTTFIDPRLPVEILDPTASLLHVPRGRMRSRSEGEEDMRSNGYPLSSSGSSRQSGPPVQPRPVETLSRDHSGRRDEVPMAYNEKVVAFLRQPNIMDILRERQAALATNNQRLRYEDKVAAVRQDGMDALERLSNDVELIILLSLFEEDIMSYMPSQATQQQFRSALASSISPHDSPQQSPHSSPVVARANHRAPAPYRRDFDAKLRSFYRKLDAKGFGQGPTKLKLTIRRDHLLEDAFGKIMAISRKDIQKCKLFICFAGEEGLDYGGPSREFFFLLSRELFNPYYGLFEYSAIDTYTVQISPMSAFVDNYLDWFRFCGRVVGLAIIHHFLLDAFFTRPFYKALLRQPCTLSDLESLDSEFYQSLLWMKDNDITDALDLVFTVDEEMFGQLVERELKPNGKNIMVTEKNKKEYIEKMVKWRIERGVSEQTDSLVKGFYEVVDSRLVSVFDARELELVIAGTAEIDVTDWRKHTEYRGGYHDKHHVVNWFWNAVERFDNERRLRLLQFVTGTSSIPYEGFAALRGSNGPRKFCIEKWGKITSLPRAHTCFNRLDLPPYTSYAQLLEKLTIAVEETSTFGID